MQLEICVDSVESAIAAERGGASRLELCADLLEGGTTPSAGIIALVRRNVEIGVFVMIRPRGGDFCYTDSEFEVMQQEIEHGKKLGADGFVFGILDEQGQVDVPRTRALVDLARPFPVTFHRAIDMTPDPTAAVESVIQSGAVRILTSGGTRNVTLGATEIARMVEAASGRIAIMAGSGVSPHNIADIAEKTGATEFHASARSTFPNPVQYRKRDVAMGDDADREYLRYGVRSEDVRSLATALEKVAELRSKAAAL